MAEVAAVQPGGEADMWSTRKWQQSRPEPETSRDDVISASKLAVPAVARSRQRDETPQHTDQNVQS